MTEPPANSTPDASMDGSAGGLELAMGAVDAMLNVPAAPAETGWRFGLPQLFLLILAAAVTFGSSRVFGWQHMLCNGPLFLGVAFLARGRCVEALCLQVIIFAGLLWILSLSGVI